MVMQDVTSGLVRETVQIGPLDANIPMAVSAVLSPVYTAAYLTGSAKGTPAWWMARLLRKLDERAPQIRTWDAYYRGKQPLAFASQKFREAFGGRFKAFSSNFVALVVDGTRERFEVTGFTFKTARSSKRAWTFWQENDMDAASQMLHTEALIKGIAYALVTPRRGDTPAITVEDPLDAITECDPLDKGKRLAGLKRWVDTDGSLVVYLYLPDAVWKLRTSGKWDASSGVSSAAWVPAPGDGEDFPMRNPLGVVPLIPFPNRPRLGEDGQSELDPVMSNQDAINKYRADALVAAEFAAFRQRWATGLDIPEDPVTGLPVEPFKAAVDRLWVVPPPDPEDPNPTKAEFGEFSATDLNPYQRMIESEVGAMSSISRMPYHYLLGQPQSVPPSGESLKSSEAGLIAKVKTQMVHFGEGWEEVERVALLSVGDPGATDRAAETVWRDPETRNEGVRTDSTVKAFQAGIIDKNEARDRLGYEAVDDAEPPAGAPPVAGQLVMSPVAGVVPGAPGAAPGVVPAAPGAMPMAPQPAPPQAPKVAQPA